MSNCRTHLFSQATHYRIMDAHKWTSNAKNPLHRLSGYRDALTFQKKTRRLTNWPNIATKFARRGTMRSLLLSNWSSWHPAASATQWMEFESTNQSLTSPGASSARLPAGLRPHRHLWCRCKSTWGAQKRIVGIKGRQSVAAPLESHCCKSDHLQLSISHFWPFNVAKCCQRNSRDNGLDIWRKHGV